MAWVELGVAAGVALLGGILWLDQRALLRAMRPRAHPPALARYPSVSVIRPVKGVDVELERTLRSGLEHGYPGAVQTLFTSTTSAIRRCRWSRSRPCTARSCPRG